MNPVLRKDLLGLLRLRRVAAIQIFFIVVCAAAVLGTWPQQGMISFASRGQDDLLLGLVLGQLVLLILFVPGMAAVSLTGEKEAGTIEMLYASRLSAAQIITGKVLSAVSYPLLLLVSGLPFVALLNWRGDVDARGLLFAYGVLVLTAILLAMLSLTVSSVCKQSATALVVAYVVVLAVCGGALVPAAIMLSGSSDITALVLHYARGLSPVAAALSLLRPQLQEFGGRPGAFGPIWQVFLPGAAVVTVVCFAILVQRLRRPPTSADAFGGSAGAADGERSIGRRVMYLIDSKKQRAPIGFLGSLNPVMAKESRTNSLRSGRSMIRVFYASLVLSMSLALMSLYGGGTEHKDLLNGVAQVLVAFQIGLIALVTPSLTSSAVSGEIENGTFEVLRLAPVGGGAMFWGKFLPAFLPAVLPVIALLPGYGAVAFVDVGYVWKFVYLLPVVALAVAFCCTLGLTASSFTSNTARATVAAYLATAALFVLPLLAWLAGGVQIDMRVAKWIAMPSPLVMAVALVGDADSPGVAPVQELYRFHLYTMGALCVLLLLAARFRLTALLRRG